MKKINLKDAMKTMQTARLQLLIEKPFFGELAMHMQLIASETAGIGTTCVDYKGRMYFNPKWVNNFTGLDEATFEIGHEVMHLVQRCSQRFPLGGNKALWNTAADIIVDGLLEEAGLERSSISKKAIPPELINRFKNCTTEQVYYTLLSEQKEGKNKKKGDGNGNNGNKGQGENDEPQGNEDEASIRGCISGHLAEDNVDAQTIEAWKQKIVNAAELVKSKGDLPGFLQDFIADITAPSITWKDIIRRQATSAFKGRRTFRRPSRRSHSLGVRLQSWLPTVKGAVIGLDTSGSISEKELSQALSECYGILSHLQCSFLNVYFHDVECYHHESYNKNTINKVKIRKGGTSHVDVFNKIEENESDIGMAIFFTDLMTEFPNQEPPYPVIWVHSPEINITPPWGKAIEMDFT